MPRSERRCLADIVEVTAAIRTYGDGVSAEEFGADDILRRAVLQRLMEIEEAAAHASPGLRAGHPEIPWADIVGFRNIAVHAYFAVDWQIVWIAAIRNAPTLAKRVGTLRDELAADAE